MNKLLYAMPTKAVDAITVHFMTQDNKQSPLFHFFSLSQKKFLNISKWLPNPIQLPPPVFPKTPFFTYKTSQIRIKKCRLIFFSHLTRE